MRVFLCDYVEETLKHVVRCCSRHAREIRCCKKRCGQNKQPNKTAQLLEKQSDISTLWERYLLFPNGFPVEGRDRYIEMR